MTTEILSPSTGQRQLKTAHANATVAHAPVVLAAGLVAVPVASANAAVVNTFDYEIECMEADKAAGQAWAGGAKVYWDDSAKEFTTTSTANTLAGRIVRDADSADTRGQVSLTPAV